MISTLPIEQAAAAHADLNLFAAIAMLLDGCGLLTADAEADAVRIQRICESAQAKAYRRYEAALARSQSPRFRK